MTDMQPLTRDDLYSLEEYAEIRPRYRAEILEHKKHRQLHIGPHATLYFEDRRTIQYQIQEMLRIERIFEPAGIEDELGAYNPLIPDGSNFKATFMLEYPDAQARRRALAELHDIERHVWLEVGDGERVYAIADEDLERSTDDKTSAVHFMRFELDRAAVAAIRNGADIAFGIDHPRYRYQVAPVEQRLRASLVADLD